jgi:hypothetical protein
MAAQIGGPWKVPGEALAESCGMGGYDRDYAYRALVTGEGREAFADRGYLAEPGAYDDADVRGRERVAASLAAYLSEDAGAELQRSAYAGLTPYQITPRQPDMEAGQ